MPPARHTHRRFSLPTGDISMFSTNQLDTVNENTILKSPKKQKKQKVRASFSGASGKPVSLKLKFYTMCEMIESTRKSNIIFDVADRFEN